MPGDGAKKANKDAKQKEFCLEKKTTKKEIVYQAKVTEVLAQCVDPASGAAAKEADCGKAATCTKVGATKVECTKKLGQCMQSDAPTKPHADDAKNCMADCKNKDKGDVAKCKFVKAVAAVAEGKEDFKCACITGAQRLATGAALVATAYLMA